MNIVLLSSVYPSKDTPGDVTPVVHYLAKEWVLSGHNVHVFHTASAFPRLYYILARPFKNILHSKLDCVVPHNAPKEYDEIRDGVCITHLSLRKLRPHRRFPDKQIQHVVAAISSYIEQEGLPDCFIGHWDNPQLELLHALKNTFHRPTCLVYHRNDFSDLYNRYGKDTEFLVRDVDLAGFRNRTALERYEQLFGKPAHSFTCASGVSTAFVNAGKDVEKDIKEIQSFVYVGTLICRKNPSAVLTALSKSFQQEEFEITYIGEGREKKRIQREFDKLGCSGKLTFTGQIPREEIIPFLEQADVFVMISRGEVFGLVYLEAMALGCITIASRHEGVDGIIEDGVNGFLCEAGNSEELASIITKIRGMSHDELNAISRRAKETARVYSDANVAANYIHELDKIVALQAGVH